MDTKNEIVTHILDKDTEYFSKLYSNHEEMLKSIALKLTGSKIYSENLISEVFKELWDSPQYFKDSSDTKISTFLMKRVVYNHVYYQRYLKKE